MKKFDIKWLLILVLVIVLAFGLVACGNKGGGNETPEEEEEQKQVDPNKSDAAEFFGTLWDASKSLGSTVVNPLTDKVHIGAAMDISLTSDNVAELDVGVKFGLVADLAKMNATSGADLGDTALMLQAYDKVTGDNWITLWYFLNNTDKDYIYLRVQDQYFKVAFDAYWNNEFSTLLEGVLKTDYEFLHNGNASTNFLALINGIAKTGGSDWTLDSLILGKGEFKGLLATFGLDLGELLASLPDGLLGKGTDTSSLGSILKAMGGVVVESKECKKYANADGSTTYKAGKLSTTATTLLNGFTDNLFKSINSFSLQYNVTAAGAIDDLVISIAGKKDLANAEIKIAITELTIEKTTQDAEVVLGKKANTYKSYANISFSGVMDASAWGIVINPNDYPISIGRVTLDIEACLDLVGDRTHNQTVASLALKNDGVLVLKAVYKDNALILKTKLDNDNNKNIAKAALYPLAKWIKEAAVTGDDVTVPYAIFGLLADAVLDKTTGMFTWNGEEISGVNANFDTIAITNVDIATLAKGAFYAIFSDFATGADKEKPAKAAELTTYDGDTYKLGSYTYEKGQYAWALDIKQTATVVLKAINYAGTASQKDKDYSIELSSIAATLKSIFKKATIESVEKTKADVAAPTNVDEMMALFMCTNDGILLDMTKHGLLPLYDKTTGITNKYIGATTAGNTLTLADAIDGGYYAISGKMISKDNAKALWAFFTNPNPTGLTLTGITTGTYFNPDHANEPEKDDLAGYATNSAIAWFVKFINGTQLTNGKTAANIVGDLTGTNSGIKISLNRETGAMGCEITLAGSKLTGTATYKFYGSDDNTVALAKDNFKNAPALSEADYTVNLDSGNFYLLFEAAFGMGPTTKIDAANHNYGINTDLYIIVDAVPVYSEGGQLTSVSYAHQAIILSTGDDGGYYAYKVTNTGVDHLGYGKVEGTTLKILDEADNTTVLASYTIYGDAYKLIKQN